MKQCTPLIILETLGKNVVLPCFLTYRAKHLKTFELQAEALASAPPCD